MSAGADFRSAVEAGDIERAIATLAPDVVFHSPATFKPFEGRELVGHVLRTVFTVFEDFRYVAELEGDGATALVFKACVGDREVDGIDLVRENAEGLIDDFTVLVRPLSGLQALAQAMGERLGARPPGA
jgi:hypothetical protein